MEEKFIRATMDDVGIIRGVLGEAFLNDPLVNWVSKHPDYAAFVFEMLLPFYLEYGEVWLNQEKNAVLMCLKPGCDREFTPSLRQVINFLRIFGIGAFWRINKLSLLMKKHHIKQPHYYILAVGTTSEARSKGYGGEIMRFLAERAKLEGIPIYGENSNLEINSAMYGHLGAKSLRTVTVCRKKIVEFEPMLYEV